MVFPAQAAMANVVVVAAPLIGVYKWALGKERGMERRKEGRKEAGRQAVMRPQGNN